MIRKRREARGWSQRQLAEALGVSLRTITSWERGDATPRRATVLDDVLGTSDDTRYLGPLLYECRNAELIGELARRLGDAERARSGFTTEELGIEDGLPEGVLDDPHLVAIVDADRNETATNETPQSGAGG